MTTFTTTKFSSLSRLKPAIAGILMLGCGVAMSAVVTTNELKLEEIFSQAGFGGTIDFRFTASKTLFNTALLTIDNEAEWETLRWFAGASAYPVVNMFFVDQIKWCGVNTTSIVGCATVGGHDMMLDSGYAANPAYGGAIAAHELGHNLGLDHFDPNSNINLMNGNVHANGSTALTGGQISSILGSSLIQTDTLGQRFITVTPILVAASIAAVPEPETWAMMVAGLLGIAGWVRRRKSMPT